MKVSHKVRNTIFTDSSLVLNPVHEDTCSIVLYIPLLTALMMEQCTKLMSSEYIGELQQDIEGMDRVRRGMVQLLYVSPASILSNPQWKDMLLLPVYLRRL